MTVNAEAARRNGDLVLTGNASTGATIWFTPDDVLERPLYSKLRRLIGVAFVEKTKDYAAMRKWAASAEKHLIIRKTLSDENLGALLERNRADSQEEAQWVGDYANGGAGPIFLDAHGEPDYFYAALQKGASFTDGSAVGDHMSIQVSGGAYAEIVNKSRIFRQIYDKNRSSSFVALSCLVGSGKASRDFRAVMERLGYKQNQMHFANGRLQYLPDGGLFVGTGELVVAFNKGWTTYKQGWMWTKPSITGTYTAKEDEAIRAWMRRLKPNTGAVRTVFDRGNRLVADGRGVSNHATARANQVGDRPRGPSRGGQDSPTNPTGPGGTLRPQTKSHNPTSNNRPAGDRTLLAGPHLSKLAAVLGRLLGRRPELVQSNTHAMRFNPKPQHRSAWTVNAERAQRTGGLVLKGTMRSSLVETTVYFTPSDVVERELYNGKSQLMGVSFTTKDDHALDDLWAKGMEKHDTIRKTLSDETLDLLISRGRADSRDKAPWSKDLAEGGDGVIVLDNHGARDYFHPALKKGTLFTDEEVLFEDNLIEVTGSVYAEIVDKSKIFQRIYQKCPSTSFVGLICHVGFGKASSEFRTAMERLNEKYKNNKMYFARDVLVPKEKNQSFVKAGELVVYHNRGWAVYEPGATKPSIAGTYTADGEKAIRARLTSRSKYGPVDFAVTGGNRLVANRRSVGNDGTGRLSQAGDRPRGPSRHGQRSRIQSTDAGGAAPGGVARPRAESYNPSSDDRPVGDRTPPGGPDLSKPPAVFTRGPDVGTSDRALGRRPQLVQSHTRAMRFDRSPQQRSVWTVNAEEARRNGGSVLTGTLKGAKEATIYFTSADVAERPLYSKSGRLIGVSFEPEKDYDHTKKWAAGAEKHDTIRQTLSDEGNLGDLLYKRDVRDKAPWEEDYVNGGAGPIFFANHGEPDHFYPALKQETTFTNNDRLADDTLIEVEGDAYAEIVDKSRIFRQIYRKNRSTSFVGIICLVGSGKASRDFSAAMVSRGYANKNHFPNGFLGFLSKGGGFLKAGDLGVYYNKGWTTFKQGWTRWAKPSITITGTYTKDEEEAIRAAMRRGQSYGGGLFVLTSNTRGNRPVADAGGVGNDGTGRLSQAGDRPRGPSRHGQRSRIQSTDAGGAARPRAESYNPSSDDRPVGDRTPPGGPDLSKPPAVFTRGPDVGTSDQALGHGRDSSASGLVTLNAQAARRNGGLVLSGTIRSRATKSKVTVWFTPDDVLQRALYGKPDKYGMARFVGVSFTKEKDYEHIKKWVASVDKHDTIRKTLSDEDLVSLLTRNRADSREVAPWAEDYANNGAGPTFLDVHGKPDHFSPALRKSTRFTDGTGLDDDTSIAVGGDVYAEIVDKSAIFQRIYRNNPLASFVGTSCYVGGTRTSYDFVAAMARLDERYKKNKVHFPNGRLQLEPKKEGFLEAGDLAVTHNRGFTTNKPGANPVITGTYTKDEEKAIRAAMSSQSKHGAVKSVFARGNRVVDEWGVGDDGTGRLSQAGDRPRGPSRHGQRSRIQSTDTGGAARPRAESNNVAPSNESMDAERRPTKKRPADPSEQAGGTRRAEKNIQKWGNNPALPLRPRTEPAEPVKKRPAPGGGGSGQSAGSDRGQSTKSRPQGGYNFRQYVQRTGEDSGVGAAGNGDDARRLWRRGNYPTVDYTVPEKGGYGREAANMMQFGDRWYFMRGKRETNQEISAQEQDLFEGDLHNFNLDLVPYNMEIRPPGRNMFEPFIARKGKGLRPYGRDTYREFAGYVTQQRDGGVIAARLLHLWATGELPLIDLPQYLQDFAVITHVSEQARGYGNEVRRFDVEMRRIAQMNSDSARRRWNQINDDPDKGGWFWPAQRRINADRPGDLFEPDGTDSEHVDSDHDAVISEGEVASLTRTRKGRR